jgi:hypothetical protein
MSLSRRDFAKAAVVAAVAPLAVVPPGTAEAQAAQIQQSQASPEARALGEWIRARYGDRLTANQFVAVVDDIGGVVQRAGQLAQVKLANGDEPDFTFRPFRGPS